jgi:flagellar protein FliO/FliZ
MSAGSAFTSILWFIAILALIPAVLWLLKRTPAGGGAAAGVMRTVAVLPLAPNQRLVTVEVGRGESRRWLVLGVTGQQISTLHEMAPQDDTSTLPPPPAAAPFAQLLGRLQGTRDDHDAR